LFQEEYPTAYFSKMLKGSHVNYSTYDKKLHDLIRSLQNWKLYLLTKVFTVILNL